MPTPGEVTDVRVLSSGRNMPTRIGAHVAFTGSIESPTLAVVQDANADIVRVVAFATPATPMFGFGVIPVDRKSRHAFDLETTIMLPQAGRYRVEGLSGAEQMVTATAEMQIE
jgi:hypothetical protein